MLLACSTSLEAGEVSRGSVPQVSCVEAHENNSISLERLSGRRESFNFARLRSHLGEEFRLYRWDFATPAVEYEAYADTPHLRLGQP